MGHTYTNKIIPKYCIRYTNTKKLFLAALKFKFNSMPHILTGNTVWRLNRRD